MDNKDWIALKAIAQEKSITKAAERLFLSQPALTYRLRNLEKEFGVAILSRRTGRALLTEQGEYLLQYAEEMLTQLNKTKEHVRSMSGEIQGPLRIGSSTTYAQWVLAPLLKTFKEQFPLVDLHVRACSSLLLMNLLREQEINIAIIRGDAFWPENKHLLQEEPLCLICSQPILLENLQNIPWIKYDIDFTINATDEDWWRENYTGLPITNIKVDKIDTCLQMVQQGLGWAIVPKIWLQNHPLLHSRPMFWKNGSPITRKTWLLFRHDILERTTVKAFINHLLTYSAEAALPAGHT